MKLRTIVLAAAILWVIVSFGGKASAYSTPPDWMPMTMLDISFNSGTSKLAIIPTTFAASLVTNTNTPGLAAFDPAQPYAVLNGTAFSRRFGWNDPGYMMADSPANDPSSIVYKIKSIYGAGAEIWIQSLSKSPGLNTYQAVGADGLQMGNTYPGIFGTAGSSAKWQWDGMMDHNTYAVPFSSILQPNQFFSAYYKIYVGDATGNELSVDKNGNPIASSATDTTWGWQGPPFVFTSQTGVATSTLIESDMYTHTDAGSSISISGPGGEYAISTDGGLTWGAWTAAIGTINTNDKIKVHLASSASPGSTTTAQLAIPNAVGPGTFSVTTLGPVTTPTAFSLTSQTGVATSTFIESSVVTVAGINVPVSISISAGGEYSVSTDGGASWSTYSSTTPAMVANGNRVKVRQVSSSNQGVTTSTTLTISSVSAAFVVTTGNPVTPSLFFNPITNAPANTNTSGMPFYVTSNAIAAPADSTISVAGGITPQYEVSTNGGVSWSAWSSTMPTAIATGNLVKVRVVPANTPFTTSTTNLNMGSAVASFSVTTGYMNPPSWMPMAMLNVAFNTGATTLSVQDENTHPSFTGGTLPALTYIPSSSYDPTKPWSVLNGGVAISRQLGWDDNTALHGNGITVPGSILYQVQAAYGASAGIWIESTSKSPGLETYFADGMFGVGGTGNGTSGSPQVYSDMMTGLPIIYNNNYYGIFGTNGSSTKWQWNGTMIHNVYAVSAAYLTQPNQLFTATYRVYIGDSMGNDIAPAAATTKVWTWKGPAVLPDNVPDTFSFTPLTGVAPATIYESNAITVTGINTPAPITISSGGSYAMSTDNGATWSTWTASDGTVSLNNQVKVRNTSSASPNTAVVTMLTIGGGTGNFSVTTNAYIAPPTWMPMTMLDISLTDGKLAIVELANKSPFNTTPPTYPVLSMVAPDGAFDPAKPWAVLNGTAYSRRLGWNPATGFNVAAVQAAFGSNAAIWIERISASPGLETFQAVGSYGVNSNNTTTVDPAANGYTPIFGTAGSSTKWKWDYMMDHNTNAVPAAYITMPNQHFSATYRIYVGDSSTGEDIAPAAATTTTWGWTGPATVPENIPETFSFTSQTGVAVNTVIESNSVTVSGLALPALISITGGGYSVSADGGTTWSAYSTTIPATVANGNLVKVHLTSAAIQGSTTTATLTIGGVTGTFSVNSRLSGDVNSDNTVNVFDALLVLQYAVNLYQPPNDSAFRAAADVAPLEAGKPKGDVSVDVFDALAILRHAVGLDMWL